MAENFFPPRPPSTPTIYAYTLPNSSDHDRLVKIGFTARDAKSRIREQVGTAGVAHEIIFEASAMRPDGSAISDHDIHKLLRKKQIPNPHGEWFECTIRDIQSAISELRDGLVSEDGRTQTFGMRPEQTAAVEKTIAYFNSFKAENQGKTPHFMWNAKMRFGKTFATYQLAKRMGWTKILVLTFKPAVENAWQEDLAHHVDFKGWQFVSRNGLELGRIDHNAPIVCFGSFQDFLGKNPVGGIKAKNEWVHATNWDCVVFDEYHYGAWRENAKELFEAEDKKEQNFAEGEGMEYFDEENMPITTGAYLYLSGTPFRAIATGEFIEEQIYNWTYSDEQNAKANWKGEQNPYEALPRMVLLTYQMPPSIRDIAKSGEFDEFDLNVFFSATGEGDYAHFKYQSDVQKWLDLIRGSYSETAVDELKLGIEKPPMPFSDARLKEILLHTFWFLPTVASCYAMRNLLLAKNNQFYHDYKVIVAAGMSAGIGVNALQPVKAAMGDPLRTKTITLSCGKLTTGVSVKPWSGILMLRNCSSPETYFQSAFRVQTPWVIQNPDGKSPNATEIIKNECYVFDFAPDRALRQVAEYSCRLNVNETNPEKKVEEFIKFLPVLAYDGSSMRQINAGEVLDYAMSGTSATLLARKWESALLVNVDNITLKRLFDNKEALSTVMNIEAFRSLNQDIETIINKSEAIKKAKADANDRELSKKEKEELTKEEKEYKSLRKEIQDKLKKFATRIPVFMYLTDYRERTLKEVITQLEPALFRKVTGLTREEFEVLSSIGLFNSTLMNDAIYKFKRYEDASLEYTGINQHESENVGGFDTVLTANEFKNLDVRP
jgi:hypothetical protein